MAGGSATQQQLLSRHAHWCPTAYMLEQQQHLQLNRHDYQVQVQETMICIT
jgi:hypothetical protein